MGTGLIEYTPPGWLSTSFMEKVLKDFFKNDVVTILSLSSQDASAKGLSFASVMHRVIMEIQRNGEVENFSVIIKAHPKGVAGMVAHKNKLFQREITVYTEILPKVNAFLEGVNDFTKISPTCYFSTDDTPDVMLILEDMRASNFGMFEKGRLLNLEHILLVIQKIAKLHACSAVIAANNPDIMNHFLEGSITNNPQRQDFLGFFPANFKSLAKEVIQWPGYEEIAGKLFALEKNVIPKAIEMYESKAEEFKVFNMGDLWVGNILFQLNDQLVPEDAVLLDYQIAYYGSPAIDLAYLIFGSLNENVRKVHFKFIVREYHLQLKQVLERLGYKGVIPTLREIHIEIIRKSLLAVIASVCLTPLLLMETDRFTELEGLFDRSERGDNFRRANIQNPKYKAFIQKTLKEYELSGFLD